MFTTSRPYSDEEWEKINSWLDRIYADFTGKVAQGRGMSQDQVHEIARGRVWTGADAAGIGLVDQLGGLDTAMAVARQKASLPEGAAVRLYPRAHPLDRLRPPDSSEARPAAAAATVPIPQAGQSVGRNGPVSPSSRPTARPSGTGPPTKTKITG